LLTHGASVQATPEQRAVAAKLAEIVHLGHSPSLSIPKDSQAYERPLKEDEVQNTLTLMLEDETMNVADMSTAVENGRTADDTVWAVAMEPADSHAGSVRRRPDT
jgi:hypothetical protein